MQNKWKNFIKRAFSCVLVVVMTLTAAPLSGFVGMELPELNVSGWLDSVGEWFSSKASALDATGKCGENVTYTYDSSTGELVISGTGEIYDYDACFSPFYYNDGIKSVVIENGVTSIGSYVFCNCKGLINTTISNSVTSIEEGAFSGCTGLTSIAIPDSVTRIETAAFYSCTSLTNVVIPDSVTYIGGSIYVRGAFEHCTGLTSITIPNSVTSIDDHAFYECYSLTSITLPDSITHIGDSAFYSCSSLKSITLPDSVTNIEVAAFAYTGLTSIVIPDSVTEIDWEMFNGCKGLTSVTLPDRLTYIGQKAFYNCTSLESITIPDSVTGISDSAFYGCKGLTTITIGNSVKGIGDEAFAYCSNLTKINWNAESVNDFIYDDDIFCKAGRASDGIDVVFGANVKTVPRYAFYVSYDNASPKIKSVTIPKSITSIGSDAFRKCCYQSTVYYCGSKEEWNAITIGSNNTNLTSATIIFNYNINDAWKADKVKIEFRFADTKKLIDTSDEHLADQSVGLNFHSAGADVTDYKSAKNGILYLDDFYFPLDYVKAEWQSAFAPEEYIYLSDNTINAEAGDTIVLYLGCKDDGSMNHKTAIQGKTTNYGVGNSVNTVETEIKEAATEYANALQHYIDMFKLKKQASTTSSTNTSLDQKIQAIKNVSTKDKIYAVPLGTTTVVKNKEEAICYVLALIFDDLVDNKIDLGKIDFSKKEVEIAKNLATQILNSFGDSISKKAKYNGYWVTVDIGLSVGNAFTGSYKISTTENGAGELGLINSSKDTTFKTLNAYCQSLTELVDDACRNALASIFNELSDVTGLTGFVDKNISGSVKNAMSILESKGYGKVKDTLFKGREVYANIKEIVTTTSDITALDVIKDTKKLRDLYELVYDTKYSDSNITDKAAAKAVSELKAARTKLYNALYNKLYGMDRDTANPIQVLSNLTNIKIKCPVDIEVYDQSGNLIAYVDTLGRHDEYIFYSEDVYIEVEGNEKLVYHPIDKEITIKYIPTDDGEMTCVIERIQSGNSVERLNYYHIPLTIGEEYTQEITDTHDLKALESTLSITGQTEFLPNEYLSAEDDTAHVRVLYSATTGGSVMGDMYYPKGECAVLYATADDGYRFAGWYVNNECVSVDEIYRFAAIEDVLLEARFETQRTLNKEYDITLSDDYFLSTVKLYDGADALDYICLEDVDISAVETITIKEYDSNKVCLSENSYNCRQNTSTECWIDAIPDVAADSFELYDTNGVLIALFSKSNEQDRIVNRLVISDSSIALTEGEQAEILYLVMPSDADANIQYTTADSAVATVDENGLISAVGAGETEITLYVENDASIHKSCKVVVSHDYISITTSPTCTEDGYTTYKCSVCDDTYNDDIVPATGHTYKTEITISPTCTEDGYTTYKCSVCDDTYNDDIVPATGHTEVIDAAIDATCTESGLTEGKNCSVCGEVLVAQEEVPALGHTDEDHDGNCDICGEMLDAVKNCSHICHKGGFAGFIWKIINLLNKLFRINKTCECGMNHY